MSPTFSVLSDRPARLGECPVWSVREQVLYWIDIDGRTVHRTDLDRAATDSRQLAGRPASLAVTAEPRRLLLAIEHELCLLDWESGSVSQFVAIPRDPAVDRLNDGRCDPAGRFVVGSMCADRNDAAGRLYRVDPDGTVVTLRTGVGLANGLAFDADRKRMYFADTASASVTVSDYDADSGEVGDPRPFGDAAPRPGKPDGACLDEDGCYWSAAVYGWALLRFTPDGRLDRRVELPVQKPSMPCFAGTRLDTLVVTTISSGGATPSEPGRDGFSPGDLLAFDAGVRGVPEPEFATPPVS